ncbi:DMT family transporter [Leekyejoonella antrihumi]|uniref:DMT family transporter n=1 Tax=Leekyejoonella antrihumi TaxID=1660198 RepID=A0A563E0M0_9MICO|nr:DMT family transporter [Leekyejoonella antrihumi]TWP36067.1 hypothetical protein FGL98_11495 [Leekyejoonella antrihumi]
MSVGVVVGLTLGGAVAFGASSALKHASAAEAPDAQSMRPSHIGRFIRATVTHRLWLGAVVCDVVGLVLQIFALHLGALALVQPLLVSGLVFALIFRWLFGTESLNRRQGLWALILTASLAVFLLMSAPHSASGGPEHVDKVPAIVVGCLGIVMVLVLIELGRRQRVHHQKAAVLGIAVGIVYAASAALLKAVTDVASSGLLHIFTSWQLYAFVAAGATGLLLNQLAFQAGPLSASLPATSTVDPLLSIVIGVAIYDEQVRHSPFDSVVLVAVLLVVGLAVVQLVRATETGDSTEPRVDPTESGDVSREPRVDPTEP